MTPPQTQRRHAAPTQRRHAARGDERRAALLAALDEHLQDSSLETVTIAEISRNAGVTRSAFYFYFANKAEALAALVEDVYDEAFAAADLMLRKGDPAENIEAGVRSLFGTRDRHHHLFSAMLEARGTSPAVRDLWDADRRSFVPQVASLIAGEREAGRAPDGVEATALASVLLELNDRMLERLTRGDALDHEDLVATVVQVWLRSIYGTGWEAPA